ncbi:NUDIX domain-containing protein [Patescibacteria group bacterium]
MIKVEIGKKEIPVCCAMDFEVSIEVIVESIVFQGWKNSLDQGLLVKSILVQSVDTFRDRVGFLKILVSVTDAEGRDLPGICFLRGGTVIIMPRIECDGMLYTLLTEQARVPVGKSSFLELPAGMLDDHGSFSGAAAKEINEETGLVFMEDQLIDISPNYKPVYLSPGGSDEYAAFLATERIRMTREELDEIHGRITGAEGENERIKVKVIPLTELFKSTQDGASFIMLSAYLKYQGLLKKIM